MPSYPALAYVGVGSNVQPDENVVRALEILAERPDVLITGISIFYRTAPLSDPEKSIGLSDQAFEPPDPDFLNGVLEIRTSLSSDNLLSLFSETERSLGRARPGNRFGPRTMDLDLLLYGWDGESTIGPAWEEIGEGGFLVHKDIETRPFVACPLLELAPDLLLPPHGIPLRAFTATFDTPGGLAETEYSNSLRSRFLPS